MLDISHLLVPKSLIDPVIESVKLEIHLKAASECCQFTREALVGRYANSVGVEHDEAKAFGLRQSDHPQDVGVKSWLTATDLENLGFTTLDLQVEVHHPLDLFQAQIAIAALSEAATAAKLTALGNLNETNAGMLFVGWTETTIVWTSALSLRLDYAGCRRFLIACFQQMVIAVVVE
jgi:hypothetical protein